MVEEVKVSEKYLELIRMGLLNAGSFTGDFRMPTARVYVPLSVDYHSYDSLKLRDGEALDAQLVGSAERNPQETSGRPEPATTIVRPYTPEIS